MQIELDAFSGRPNPRWNLSGEQQAEFLKRLHALKTSPSASSTANGLGYRGFLVRQNGKSDDAFDEMRIYRGTVVVLRGDHSETLADSGRELERWLLASAQGHVEDSVLQYVSTDFTR